VGFDELKNQNERERRQYQNHIGPIGAYKT
jgi:hypothetical protein